MIHIPSFGDVVLEYPIVENESLLLDVEGPANSLLLIIKPVLVSITIFQINQFVPIPQSEKRAKLI